MKRIFIIIAIQTLAAMVMMAQDREKVFERTYISSDKSAYVSGDRIWCSAFCFDLESKALSQYSSIAYVELVTEGSILQSAKIALEGGRGSGFIDIPETVPTGNYRLLAFTTENKNEPGYDFLSGSKVISVYNPVSSAKLKDGVEILSKEEYSELENNHPVSTGHIRLDSPSSASKSGSMKISLGNVSSKPVSLSVSVYHDDGIILPDNASISEITLPSVDGLRYEKTYYPDYEGEVIYGKISGKDAAKVAADASVTAYISTPGSLTDTYTSLVKPDGSVSFRTYNIFGNKDLVCEIADLNDESLQASIDILSPFVNVSNVKVPVLPISENIGRAVVDRGRSMQLFKEQFVDTLYQLRGRKDNVPYILDDAIRYNLDDYTRFPTMKEVLVEIISEARVRGRNSKQVIQVYAGEEGNKSVGEWKPSLVLLDGVPVFKHQDMMNYDALLLQGVEIWPYSYFFAQRKYDGVINFVSKTGNLAFMDFGSNVKIVDYKGACYPMDFTKRFNGPSSNDMRRTIYWNPELEMNAGEDISIECLTPDYAGKFDIVVEGVTSDGEPIYKWTTFVVR